MKIEYIMIVKNHQKSKPLEVRRSRKKLEILKRMLADYAKYDNLPTSKLYFLADISYTNTMKKSIVGIRIS